VFRPVFRLAFRLVRVQPALSLPRSLHSQL
jgi:hypothetical protein